MGSLRLNLTLDVLGCSCCGGDHTGLRFVPARKPEGGKTHQGVCPKTGTAFWIDTQKNPGAWAGLLKAAGVQDA